MGGEVHKLSTTYSSGLIVSPDVLPTLAVYFDEINLPYPYHVDRAGIQLSKDRGGPLFADVQDFYSAWKEQWEPLFQQGVLRTLPAPVENPSTVLSSIGNVLGPLVLGEFEAQPAIKAYLAGDVSARTAVSEDLSDPDFANIVHDIHKFLVSVPRNDELMRVGLRIFSDYLFSMARAVQEKQEERFSELMLDLVNHGFGLPSLVIYAMYAHKPSREFYIPRPTVDRASAVVQRLLQWWVPSVGTLTPEQVLEVRNCVSRFKEGFQDYIFESLEIVEGRISRGETVDEAALNTVVEKLRPKLDEFRRQFGSKVKSKSRFLWKAISSVGKVLSIDVIPWEGRIAGKLISTFASSPESVETQLRSNAGQFVQFLVTVQSKVSAPAGRASGEANKH